MSKSCPLPEKQNDQVIERRTSRLDHAQALRYGAFRQQQLLRWNVLHYFAQSNS